MPHDPTIQTDAMPNADSFTVRLRNCNNIHEGFITLHNKKLNIKYGPNGTGKSTVARALVLNASGEDALNALTPFKLMAGRDESKPTVEGMRNIDSVLVFDDNYVSQFTFQSHEVLRDSFEIFINTPAYQEGLQRIDAEFANLKAVVESDSDLQSAIAAFEQLKEAFKMTTRGALSKSSKGVKALAVVEKLHHIPSDLEGYRPFLESKDPGGWVSWQSKGNVYAAETGSCPYCSRIAIDTVSSQRVSEVFESTLVRNLSQLRDTIDGLGNYISSHALEQLRSITTTIDELTPEQSTFIARVHEQISILLAKLQHVRNISFRDFRQTRYVEALAEFKIDLGLLPMLNSDSTERVVTSLNSCIDEIIERTADIAPLISKQKGYVRKLIEDHQTSINRFLSNAGYRYRVRIDSTGLRDRMILEHEDRDGHLENAAQHLSYGERNAFSLVLFMHHALQTSPDLVVLDDPISSFDKTKKFAILHDLFNGNRSLKRFTTLMLTHDIEPIIDIMVSGPLATELKHHVVAHHLRTSRGILEEKRINSTDVLPFTQVCDKNISEASDPAIRCIYLRRKLEVVGRRSLGYEVLSNVLHLRATPIVLGDDREEIPMTEDELEQGIREVRKELTSTLR